jgi:ABC-type Fe3+-hydroxamate transport system substrate-binding protein
MHDARRWPVLWIVSSALLALLTACASTSRVALPVTTATSGPIQIATSHRTYPVNRPIGIVITNQSKTTYYVLNTYSNCDIAQLQYYDTPQAKWVNTQPCNQAIQKQVLKIPGSFTEPLTFAPGNSTSNPNEWRIGTYRVQLRYSSQSDGGGTLTDAYSATFVVK